MCSNLFLFIIRKTRRKKKTPKYLKYFLRKEEVFYKFDETYDRDSFLASDNSDIEYRSTNNGEHVEFSKCGELLL